ncbi:MAG TPA: Gfo/Idh/MocA family oxidoreductase [Verrucomicrobiae bacterium]|jgi:predicted dehydrogenase|nr:Gfo/Idh/MocA family oxidoreductase [Verrucomicrobiae bacterium]
MKKGLLAVLCLTAWAAYPQAAPEPVSLAVVGLAHDGAGAFLAALRGRSDAQLAAIVEPDRDLREQYQRRFSLAPDLFYTNFDDMRVRAHPGAVVSFTRTVQHRAVVEACAASGLDVLLEKPLAMNFPEAQALAAAARKAGIQIIVDYETAWYPANQSAYEIVHTQRAIGAVRKLVARAGHRGPKEIGCSPAFLAWLTDPAQSGGGALVDFGCYGADLVTWMMEGRRPVSVVAAAQQIKPEVYPKVEDEATIVLEYPGTQAIIEASWNWPYEVNDLEVFGRQGYVQVPQRNVVRVRKAGSEESEIKLAPSPGGAALDEISYFVSVVRRQTAPAGLASLEMNLTVMEILDAARESVRTGRKVELPAAAAPK